MDDVNFQVKKSLRSEPFVVHIDKLTLPRNKSPSMVYSTLVDLGPGDLASMYIQGIILVLAQQIHL